MLLDLITCGRHQGSVLAVFFLTRAQLVEKKNYDGIKNPLLETLYLRFYLFFFSGRTQTLAATMFLLHS